MPFNFIFDNFILPMKIIFKTVLQYLNFSYSQKLKTNQNLYSIQANYKGKNGKQLVVCKINDSSRSVFIMPALELVQNRKDILSGFSTEDIINIVGFATSEKEPIIVETRESSYKYLSTLSIMFIFILIVAAITSSKLAEIGGIIIPAGLLWYQPSYLISDTITEVYGYKKMRKLIWLSALCYLLLFIMLKISVILPSSDNWNNQIQYSNTLNSISKISLSGLISFTVSEFLNSYVLAKLKLYYKGRFLILRLLVSTLIDTFSDCFLFTLISYSSTLHQADLLKVFAVGYSVRVIYDIFLFPITYALINHIKDREQCNIFDINTDFTPFSLDTDYLKKNQ